MSKQTRAQRHETIQARTAALAVAAGVTAAVEPDTATQERTHAELWLYGVVGGYWFGFNAKSVGDQLRGLDVDDITVRLHSPGGDAIEGIAIGNLLRNHRATVRVVVDGLAASAGSVIALAGDEVVMSPGSQFMIHDPWMFTIGNEAELRADADFLGKQSDNYADVYALRATGKTAAQWRDVMRAETWFTAQEAVDEGLADRVGTVTAIGTPPADPADDFDADEMAARAAWDLDVLVHPAARAAWSDRSSAPKPPSASAVGSTTPKETESAVAFSDEQMKTMRAKLGLSEDADEATIVAALDESLEERATSTTTIPEGMALVESAVLEDLRAGAAAGRSAREELNTQARDRAISSAIAQGKTTPARREHWEASWKGDPEGTKALLDALEPGLAVPVEEAGHAEDTEPKTSASLEDIRNDELFQSWKVS